MLKLLQEIVVAQLLINMFYKRNQNIDSEFFSVRFCLFERISSQVLGRADVLTPQFVLLHQQIYFLGKPKPFEDNQDIVSPQSCQTLA